jgi:hypothetical protein
MINWNNIRPLNGSQQEGFEELVCQLARQERPEAGETFVRVGKPDGGKECFWQTPGGEIYAWQAKYFPASFTDTQWKQIEKSVTDTIDKHPGLVNYTICCPLDRPDGKVTGRTSLLGKWQQKVKSWETYASKKGMTVRFIYWGGSEMIKLLAKKRNEGLRYFWFNQEEFTDEWFTYKNNESIHALGGRYTADLNIELPLARCFDGLARDEQFNSQLLKNFNSLYEAARSLHLPNIATLVALEQELTTQLDQFRTVYLSINLSGIEIIAFDQLITLLDSCQEATDKINDELYRLQEEKEGAKPRPAYSSPPFSMEISNLRKLSDQLYSFSRFLNGPQCGLANLPSLILSGEAGAGKSHLLADLVNRRAKKGQLSLLLLGESFTTRTSPWSQILQHQLRKATIDEHTLLGALNARAEISGTRLLLIIDALNEGEGRFIWPKNLQSFTQLVLQYPYLGLVVSIRDTFVDLIAPVSNISEELSLRIEHSGFADISYQATLHFFRHYGILPPGSPLLNPEFQNPLFLKLFCQSLKQRGLHSVPAGYSGITAIIDFYLDGINHKLAGVGEWEYDERMKLVRKAVEKCLEKMVETGTEHLGYEEAAILVEEVFQGKCNRTYPYLERLISEGVFHIDLFWDDAGNDTTVVYFAYQRFQDHLLVAKLLDLFLDKTDPVASFQSGRLLELVKDQRSIHLNRNLIEALAIQVPEQTGLELFEVAPACKNIYAATQSFVRSLIWRRADSIGASARDYVNEVIIHDYNLADLFLDTAISTTMRPGYYFNANSLHNYLMGFNMQTRDLEWTTWLQNKYGPDTVNNAVQRLIDWGFDAADDQHITDEAITLGVTTLAWFLTSCNRYLRDTATKSMVNLLQYRMHLIVPLLHKFEKADDVYIAERLYAVAYGCVLRAGPQAKLKPLAIYTFEQIFNQPLVVAHDLLRDYARDIVELVTIRGDSDDIDLQKVRPPYRSKKIPARLPSVATIDKKYDPKGDNGNYGHDEWGATAILSSMTTEYGRGIARYGDFGRYVFGYRFSNFDVDEAKLSNYAVDLIFKMGYDPKLFSDFDGNQGSGRGSGHKERIGKKYQWIVLHELLARVSDHCKLYERHYMPELGTLDYEGPWDGSRDIDPSLLIRKMKRSNFSDRAEGPWFKKFTHQWEQDNYDWIRDNSGQPPPGEVILFTDSEGTDWLWLDVHPVWTQPGAPGQDKYEGPYKEVWYIIRSYFMQRQDVAALKKSVEKGFDNHQFDEAKSLSNVFNREFYDAPAYLSFTDLEDPKGDWIDIHHRRTGKKIADVLRTTEVYFWEKEFDCSKEEVISFNKPSRALSKSLDLRYSSRDGEMIDDKNQLACFDPSVHFRSTRGLLIRRSVMDAFLQKEKLALIWMVVGEKQVNARSWHGKKYPGRMNMSGIYTYEGGQILGELTFEMDK